MGILSYRENIAVHVFNFGSNVLKDLKDLREFVAFFEMILLGNI